MILRIIGIIILIILCAKLYSQKDTSQLKSWSWWVNPGYSYDYEPCGGARSWRSMVDIKYIVQKELPLEAEVCLERKLDTTSSYNTKYMYCPCSPNKDALTFPILFTEVEDFIFTPKSFYANIAFWVEKEEKEQDSVYAKIGIHTITQIKKPRKRVRLKIEKRIKLLDVSKDSLLLDHSEVKMPSWSISWQELRQLIAQKRPDLDLDKYYVSRFVLRSYMPRLWWRIFRARGFKAEEPNVLELSFRGYTWPALLEKVGVRYYYTSGRIEILEDWESLMPTSYKSFDGKP